VGAIAKTAAAVQRTCIVTRIERPPEEMIRFVLSPEGEAIPDLRRKLPGRGVWVTACAAAVDEAIRRRAFDRSFRRAVQADADMAVHVDSLLEADALQLLALANKAGAVIAGAVKILVAIAERDLAALVHARDAGRDGVAKLDRGLRQRYGKRAQSMLFADLFTSTQLDLALGRTNVIHAALIAVPAGKAFLKRVRRLAVYRGHSAGAADQREPAEPALAKRGAAAQETVLEPRLRHRPTTMGTAQGPEDA
jgi:predicted RNA-binding protein YlxR (DUF448 family)